MPLYAVDCWLFEYGMVGIASSWRLERERARTSEATSLPYCSASWLCGEVRWGSDRCGGRG